MDRSRADWFDKNLIEPVVDEQAERIQEAVAIWNDSDEQYSYQQWEDMFEDRDPFEFL